MTTSYLIPDLEFFEGEPGTSAPALVAYVDPLSGGEPYTAGFGHTGPDVELGVTYTLEQCQTWLNQDIAAAEHELDINLSWWRNLDDVRQDVMVEMCFNLGIGGLLEFHHFLAACQSGDYQTAAAHMLASEWAIQVGNRAKVLAKEMASGIHVPPETVL
jgi:lysozyme